jgi:hypothetical protein
LLHQDLSADTRHAGHDGYQSIQARFGPSIEQWDAFHEGHELGCFPHVVVLQNLLEIVLSQREKLAVLRGCGGVVVNDRSKQCLVA